MSERRKLVITGGASGLGAAIVDRAIAADYDVVVIDRNPSAVAKTIVTDLSDLASATRAGEEAVADGRDLDALVLCAGANIPTMFAEQDIAIWSKMISVNLLGNVAVTRATLHALTRGPGRLVGIGSTATRRLVPGMSAYGVSKHAFSAFFHALSLELNGVLPVTLVNPGVMDTGFFDGRPEEFVPPTNRMVPGDVADTVMFCLDQPGGVVIRELFVTGISVYDYP